MKLNEKNLYRTQSDRFLGKVKEVHVENTQHLRSETSKI